MCFRKQDTTVCQTIHVRRFHLRMTAETSKPVVEIIDGNEKNVGRPLLSLRCEGELTNLDDEDENDEVAEFHGRVNTSRSFF